MQFHFNKKWEHLTINLSPTHIVSQYTRIGILDRSSIECGQTWRIKWLIRHKSWPKTYICRREARYDCRHEFAVYIKSQKRKDTLPPIFNKTYALLLSNNSQLGWKTKLIFHQRVCSLETFSKGVQGCKQIPIFITNAVGNGQIRKRFHHRDSSCIHKIQRSAVIGFFKGIFIREPRCGLVNIFIYIISILLIYRYMSWKTRPWHTHLWNPRPSIRTTIHVWGRRLSGCSNSLTYSYLS